MKAPRARDLVFVADRRFLRTSGDGRLLDAAPLRPSEIAELAATAGEVRTDDDSARLMEALRRGTYLDYSSDQALAIDGSIMRDYLGAQPPPPPETAWTGPLAWLPHPAFTEGPAFATAVARLLLCGFGHLRTATFLDLFDVVLKPVPSKGARHPFDAYLVVGPAATWSGLGEGTYRYVPSLHALELLEDLCADAPAAAEAVTLLVAGVFERVQWRYREPAGYRDLYLDLGHLTATLALVAHESRIALLSGDPGGKVTLPSLETELLAAYSVEMMT